MKGRQPPRKPYWGERHLDKPENPNMLTIDKLGAIVQYGMAYARARISRIEPPSSLQSQIEGSWEQLPAQEQWFLREAAALITATLFRAAIDQLQRNGGDPQSILIVNTMIQKSMEQLRELHPL